MTHTPGPWIWMDESEQVPNQNNDGMKGVSWLGRDDDNEDMDDNYVLCAPYDTDTFPADHPYRQKFASRTTDGTISILNPDDLTLIAAAPDMLHALRQAEDGLASSLATWRQENGDNTSVIGAIRFVRAAIKKATA